MWCSPADAVLPLPWPRLPAPPLQDMQRPLYMQPADALAYGIIDGVVTPEKKVRAWCAQPGPAGRCCGLGRGPHRAGGVCGLRRSLARGGAALGCQNESSLPCPAIYDPEFIALEPFSGATFPLQIIDDVKSADQWDKEAGLVAR